MAASVATPLENQFSTIAGLESMTSINSLGATQITLEFDLDRSMDGAAIDVQAAITQAVAPVAARHADAADLHQGQPGGSAHPLPRRSPRSRSRLWTLDEFAETRIAQRLSMVNGVAQVQVLGAQKYAVHVQMDPHPLASHNIGINEVENALRGLERQPAHRPDHRTRSAPSRCKPSASSPAPISTVPRSRLPQRHSRPPLPNSANSSTASRTTRPRPGSTPRHGRPAGHRARHPAPAGNQHHGGDRQHQGRCCRCSKPSCRPSVHMDVLYDRSETIRESYDDVKFTMLLTLGLVIGVIFVFLRNVWATVIPSLALPVLHRRHLRRDVHAGLQPRQPVDDGADPVASASSSTTPSSCWRTSTGTSSWARSRCEASLDRLARDRLHHRLDDALARRPSSFRCSSWAACWARLFREFAVTICVAILISGRGVSVTLTPMLCSRFLRREARRAWHSLPRHRSRLRLDAAALRRHACKWSCATVPSR